ncbi:sporulation protein YunB [Fontibacillus phaseoli]|uniref:sporulation protein YunB n=1 Tax=Fontibacillus phaseoli TaxID=1416533 RepID=UPI000DF32284|nr:sporulation protein YunB [Fontibacillus phaseoli]
MQFRRGFRSRRRRWHSRRRSPRSRRKVLLVVLLIAFIAIFQFFQYVERHMREPIMHLAKIRVKQIATESINEAITSQVANEQQVGNLIDWKTDDAGKITGFMLNYSAHMRITSDTIQTVRSTLDEVSQLSEHIPLGQALGSPILASFGPGIPIKIEPKGDVKVDLNTRRQDAGINNILVEVFLRVRTELAVVVPFDMEPQAVETEIPVSYLLVVGDVPMYYYDSKGNPVGDQAGAPNIALPSIPEDSEEKVQSGQGKTDSSDSGEKEESSKGTDSSKAAKSQGQSGNH